ncbi:FAD-dependent oxidoreductase, partial [Enterobacter hormaechei]
MLVFATGSPLLCRQSPAAMRACFTFRTLAETPRHPESLRLAVVLGGGVLGVEAAAALAREGGSNVTLVIAVRGA